MKTAMTLSGFLERATPPPPEEECRRLASMLEYESRLWAQGFRRVAGVDEAGRGPIAGPIVAAAVILDMPIAKLNDSKRLSESVRNNLFACIMDKGGCVGVAMLPACEVDTLGIQQANYGVMRNATLCLDVLPDFVLVDGFTLSGLEQPVERVIKGDARSLSIAAASIVAKVTRDRYMLEMDAVYPGYGFARHKGYGTREHLDALRRLGPCPEHRHSFAPLASVPEEHRLL